MIRNKVTPQAALKWFAVMSWAVAVGGSAYFIVVTTRANESLKTTLFNADSLFLPVFFDDLIRNGGNLQDWHYPPAPFFFPEYVFQAIASFFVEDSALAMAVYAVLQIFVFGALVTWICHAANLGVTSWWVSAISVFLTAILAAQGVPAAVYSAMSVYHFGTFLNVLASIALTLELSQEKSGGRKLRIGLLTLLAGLATLSDAVYLFQFIAPLSVLAIMFYLNNTKTLISPAIYAGLASIGAYFVYYLVIPNPSRYPASISIRSLPGHVVESIQLASDLLLKSAFLGAISVLLALCMIVFASLNLFFLLRNKGTKVVHLDSNLSFSVIFTFGSLSTLAIAWLNSDLPTSARYLIPTFLLPICCLAWLIVRVIKRTLKREHLALGTLVTLCTIALIAFAAPLQQKNEINFYPSEVSCFDKFAASQKLRSGLAEYWDAKYIQGLSARDVTIAQYFSGFRKQQWITSDSFYKSRYDFAVVSNVDKIPYLLDIEELEEMSGEANAYVNCGKFTVYSFNPSGASTERISEVGRTAIWDACKLGTKIGTLNVERCTYLVANGHQPGHVFFGPYIQLLPGTYKLTTDLEFVGPSIPKGLIEVVDASGGVPKVIASKELAKVYSTEGSAVIFEVDNALDGEIFEFRLYVQNDAGLEFRKITLLRLK